MQQPDPGNIDGRYGEKTDKSWEWYKANNWGQVELALRNIDGDHIEKLNKKYDSQFTQGEKGNIYYPNKGTGKTANNNTTNITSKTFYADLERSKAKMGNDKTPKLQVGKGEIGLGKSSANFEHGRIDVKGPSASADCSISLMSTSVGARASLAEVGGAIYIPLHGNHQLQLGGKVAFISAGAELRYDAEKGVGYGGIGVGPFGVEVYGIYK